VRTAESLAVPHEERFFVGLRLMEGIAPTAAERGRYGQEIARQVEAGLLEDTGDRVRLTRRGVLVSNEVFQEFIETPCPTS
jgi:oxygen-independent coproporphyrinogen-3 oxidase